MGNSINLTTAFPSFSTLVAMGAVAFACFFRFRLVQGKKTELQLKFSRETLDFALQSGRMGTWDINLSNDSIQCSQEMLELWGFSTQEAHIQRSILQSKVHPEDLSKMTAAINSAIRSDGIYELEYRIRPQADKLRWVFARGRCSFAPGSREPVRFSGVVFDVTERKEHEEALNNAIRIRDQFLSLAGHELKTPLTNLQLQIQLKQRDLKRNYPSAFTAEKIAEGLKEQYEYVRRIGHLVDNMLDVSMISEGRLHLVRESFDLCALVTEVIGRFREGQESPGPELQFTGHQPLPGLWDRFRIEQILINLLTNAVKYGNKKPVLISLSQAGEQVHLVVRDHGIGIAPADHERVFQRFERAISENEVSGLGLGLYIAKTIAQLHGGEIRLKSELGHGAEFTLILPIQRGAGS